ncbi:hypothetical protein ACF0H5_014671 [Mactra antiquata]
MSGFYGIDSNREVIRVHVKKCDGLMQPESKKFSIDPQITSFEMLQNLLAKAFDIQSDFTISYLSVDSGQEVYLSMLSDWDMDAAFQNASDPCLKLKVDLKPFDEALEDWDIIAPVEIPQYRMPFLYKSTFLGNITGTISNKVEKTVSQVQRVMGIKSEDDLQYRPIKSPMTDMEFRNYMDSDGRMIKPEEFRLSIYQGGIEPSLRRVVWRHLLNIYPNDMSGRERFDYMKRKENEYFELRDNWRNLFTKKQVSEEAKHVAGLVKKDVLRTDRTHKYYSGGDDSKNLVALYNLLVTYALTHPEVSYCQGMSDIASPLLVVQKEEAQAYLCFCGLMKRLRTNFMYDGEAITTKLQHLSSLMQFYDPVFHTYMQDHGAEDMFFCYRWLLLEMKREFPFDDALYMLEVMWSTIPPSPPEEQLELFDSDYSPTLLVSVSPNSPSFALKTQYGHLLAKRLKNVTTGRSPRPRPSPVTNLSDNSLSKIHEENTHSNSVNKSSSTNDNSSPTDSSDSKNDSENSKSVDGKEQVCDLSSTDSDIKETTDDSFNTCNKDSDEGVSNTSAEGSNSSSYMSASQSVERFPSLISASVEERDIDNDDNIDNADDDDDDDNVQSVIESKTLTDNLDVIDGRLDTKLSDSLIGSQFDENDNNSPDKESDEQSQFHLSLEETDKVNEKKKSNVPQIKGSFFSGMKKFLASPRRLPGKAQKVGAESESNVKDSDNVDSQNSDTRVKPRVRRSLSANGEDLESEHTLFEVNNMIKSMSALPSEQFDSDSGMGSLTSSTNSLHIRGHKSRSSTHDGKEKGNNHQHLDCLSKEQQEFFDRKYKDTVMNSPRNNTSNFNNNKPPSFCEDHFSINNSESVSVNENNNKEDLLIENAEVVETVESKLSRFRQLPAPDEFGYGNPFLMFLCLTVLVQHREVVMNSGMEYDEFAMYFDKMVRKHNVNKVLHQTRIIYTEYIRMQQKLLLDDEEDTDFNV